MNEKKFFGSRPVRYFGRAAAALGVVGIGLGMISASEEAYNNEQAAGRAFDLSVQSLLDGTGSTPLSAGAEDNVLIFSNFDDDTLVFKTREPDLALAKQELVQANDEIQQTNLYSNATARTVYNDLASVEGYNVEAVIEAARTIDRSVSNSEAISTQEFLIALGAVAAIAGGLFLGVYKSRAGVQSERDTR